MATESVGTVEAEKQVAKPTDPRFHDLEGRRFGRLRVGKYLGRNKWASLWECECDCGKVTTACGSYLEARRKVSCGCYRSDLTTIKNTTHGMVDSPEYRIWCGIKQRCFNGNCDSFNNYGERGVTMFPAWATSFAEFYAAVGKRPSPDHTLDRYPNQNGNYEPGNVRWATTTEQGRNRRNNHLLDIGGLIGTLSEWSEISGVSGSTIRKRLRLGWTTRMAVFRVARGN